jgi:hypothetical protein
MLKSNDGISDEKTTPIYIFFFQGQTVKILWRKSIEKKHHYDQLILNIDGVTKLVIPEVMKLQET